MIAQPLQAASSLNSKNLMLTSTKHWVEGNKWLFAIEGDVLEGVWADYADDLNLALS